MTMGDFKAFLAFYKYMGLNKQPKVKRIGKMKALYSIAALKFLK